MSKRTNPAVIGGFVIGAILLLTLGFAIFGGSQLFTSKSRYVAYFEEATDGLRVGASVLMNGVRIGYVSDIDLLFDRVSYTTLTQVTMEILQDSYIITHEGEFSDEIMYTAVAHDTLVGTAGLRARLKVESFVTGQLFIELEMRPTSALTFRGVDPPYPEIPTERSEVQQLLTRLDDWITEIGENVDLAELTSLLTSSLEGIDELANSKDLREAIAGANTLVNDEATQNLAKNLEATIKELDLAVADARTLFRNTGDNFESIAVDMGEIQERMDGAFLEAERALATARQRLRGDSEQLYRLSATLDELQRAARATAEFFDYLERNPESLLRGKQE